MIDNMKKHWFVILVAIIFFVGIIYFANDQINSVLKGKRVEGNDVVYEINGKDLLADEYYDELFEAYGDAEVYKLFEKVTLAAMPTDKEIKEQAEEDAKKQIQYISAEEGTPGLENLDKALISLGYKGKDELNIFYEDVDKKAAIFASFIEENYDKYVKDYFEESKPRLVSHILIRMDDVENPTAEEQSKIDKVNAAIKEGKDFGQIALELSDDEQTAPSKGLLGYMDKNTEFQEEFLISALALDEGEVGEWIETSFGRHLVYIESTQFEDFKNDPAFVNSILEASPEVQPTAIWEKAKDLNIEFEDKDIELKLKTYMGIAGDQE